MRNYFKVLAITAGVQFAGFMLTFLGDDLLSNTGSSTIIPVFIGILCLLLSMIIGVVLPIKWCSGWRQKVITILVLPTNYTWLILAISVIRFVGDMLSILEDIPANFG